MTGQERILRIGQIEQELAGLPKGSLSYKVIKGKEQPYLQWSEDGRTRTRYVKVAERDELFRQLEYRAGLLKELDDIKMSSVVRDDVVEYGTKSDAAPAYSYSTNVVTGSALDDLVSGVAKLGRRDCYSRLKTFLDADTLGKVCILYGLRRTGKTTLLFQLISDLSAEERARTVYIKARVTDRFAGISANLKRLRAIGYKYVILDEITLMEDFIDCASILSDIYAMQGMKIILSGTDSLGFWMAEGNELYDRTYFIHTTYIPFREYSRLLGINDIDEYIRYGGTLMRGDFALDAPDALDETAAFRDDETARRYIDTAVCRNIQHSLAYFREGEHFRHLRDLYEAGELTSAINRIIERMNHKFLIRTLIDEFKSHDLGSAAQLLQKETDAEKRTDILDRIDRGAVTRRLMEMLEIRDQEDLKIGITAAHVAEIKEYLKALDLVVDCPSETTIPDAEPNEYVIFTQPGMRYCQAEALVHVLMKDELFRSFSEHEKKLATDKILEDVRGRMMEDIVLLDRVRSLPKGKRGFKLIMSRKEFDMAIYDSESDTIEEYEIKYSSERMSEQAQAMLDDELNQEVEAKFGNVTRRCVIYRGDSGTEGEVEYLNVEEYLRSWTFDKFIS